MKMLYLSLTACVFLFLLVCLLFIRIRILHMALQEIGKDFRDILAADTNSLVSVVVITTTYIYLYEKNNKKCQNTNEDNVI